MDDKDKIQQLKDSLHYWLKRVPLGQLRADELEKFHQDYKLCKETE